MAADEKQVGKFGRIALEMGVVTWEQIQECLSIQMDYERSGREVPRLGTLLLTRGHLTSSQLRQILGKQNSQREKKAESAANNFLVQYKSGTVIFREGDNKTRDLFLLNSGKIELIKRGVSLHERCGPGAFFGVSAFLLKTPRNATAIAKTDCKAFRIPENKAADFFKSKPAMAIKLAMVLANDLYIMKNRYVESHLSAVEARQNRAQDAANSVADAQDEILTLPDGTRLVSDGKGGMVIGGGGSASPVYINRKKANQGDSLRNGDKVQVGSHLFQFYSEHEDLVDASAPMSQEMDKLVSSAIADDKAGDTLTQQIDLDIPQGIDDSCTVEQEPHEELSSSAAELETQEVTAAESAFDVIGGVPSEQQESSAEETDESDEDEEDTEEDDTQKQHQCLTGDQQELPEPTSQPLTEATEEALFRELDGLKSPKFSKDTVGAVSHRISFWMKLEKLEESRLQLEEEMDEQSERFKGEFARQRREIQRIPPIEALRNSLEKVNERLNPKPPEPDEEGNMPPVPEPLGKDMEQAYQLAVEQKKILIGRDECTGDTLRICLDQALGEPLYRIFKKYSIDRGDVFGWMVYAQALQEYSEVQAPKIKEVRAEIDEVNNSKSGGFLGLGRKSKEEKEQKLATLQEDEKRYKQIVMSINRELKAIEKIMVDEFWHVYEQATQVLVAGTEPTDTPYLRGFLRWGLLGHSPMWFDPNKCRQIMSECLTGIADPVFRMDQNFVYYADEAIELIAAGKLPPTSNEDLELNHRNSPLWKADRAWRKIINCTMQEGIYNHIMSDLAKEATTIRKDQAAAESELQVVQGKANDKNKRRMMSQRRHQIQNCKVKAGRLERLVEKLTEETLPRSAEDKEQAKFNLHDSGITFTPAQLAEHEIKCMRRNARLVAKLKEPFLPFSLRDRYKPENGCVNTRGVVLESLQDAEMRDPLLLKEPLVPSAKKIHRILLRLPPVIVIAPAGGIMGFMMAPRAGMESGRLVLPAYFERANMKEEILWNVLSDFRFDTSKASAGVDVMNSDTLVAAYAQVRWDLRKRDKEVRQKSGIYMEENERTNWRRHYAIYMKSALDSGKLLFYKCPELYELIINKFVDLPNGCEILKR